MRKLHIALAAIEQNGRYYLQLRSGDPKIGAVGKVGFFGGKIEAGETAQAAAHREIGEETTLRPQLEELIHIGEVNVIADHKLEPVEVCAQVFKVVADAAATIEALEGELVHLALEEIRDNFHRLTPGTEAAFKELILQET